MKAKLALVLLVYYVVEGIFELLIYKMSQALCVSIGLEFFKDCCVINRIRCIWSLVSFTICGFASRPNINFRRTFIHLEMAGFELIRRGPTNMIIINSSVIKFSFGFRA